MTSQSQESLVPIENHDPLGQLLRTRFRLSPVAFGVLIFMANIVVDGLLGWRFDVFLTDSGTPGLMQDYMALVADFVFTPIMCGLYLWAPMGATRLFDKLQKSGIFKSESSVADTVDRWRPWFLNRTFFYVAGFLSLAFSFSQIAGYAGWLPWKPVGGYLDLHPPMSLARAPFWVLNAYTLFYAAFNVGVTIFILRRLFQDHDIRLQPLHPDGCGGLGSLSEYSTGVAIGIAAIGFMISAATVLEIRQGTILEAVPVLVGIAAYLALAPVFFFWPMGTAHDAMQGAKDAEMLMLAQEFDRRYAEVKKKVTVQDKNVKQSLRKLEDLRRLYRIAEEFPVWPFDTRNLRRFFAVITTPLIPAIISVTLDIVRSLFLP